MIPKQQQNFSRILFDLQACQTAGSAKRGIGNYSSSFFHAILQSSRKDLDIWAGVSDFMPPSMASCTVPENRIIRIPVMPKISTPRDFLGGDRDTVYGEILSSLYSQVCPDVIHISHLFEGFDDHCPVAIPIGSSNTSGQVLSATIYDLIPLRFKKHYFQDEVFEKFYRQRLNLLQKMDLLFAISETTRQDHINILGLDPEKIITIYGGCDPCFKPSSDIHSDKNYLREAFGIKTEQFVLYTGGDDYRKNIGGLIEAYAQLNSVIRKNCSLVIVCAMSEARKFHWKEIAKNAGLSHEEIFFLGYVDKKDLVKLTAACDCFIFPSLYEGFGLPIVEAMACEVPVIGSNNSSIKELIASNEALFDTIKPESIAQLIQRVLQDKDFSQKLRQYGKQQAQKYTWKNSANLALDAYNEAFAKKHSASIMFTLSGGMRKKRLAVLTPLPPARSGIADYSASFLPFMSRYFDMDIYVADGAVSDKNLNAAFRLFKMDSFRNNARNYDIILYEIGNSEFHAHMLPLLQEFPGVVTLHDAYLSGLMWWMEYVKGEENFYSNGMLSAHGTKARHFFAPKQNCMNAIQQTMLQLPCTKSVLDNALGVISHSRFNLEIARKLYPENWRAPYRIIPQIVLCPELTDTEQKLKIRAQLGFKKDDFIIATFGHIVWTKCGDLILDAFLSSGLSTHKKCHLVFVGELAKDDFGIKLKSKIQQSKSSGRIQITGFLSKEEYESYLAITDLAIQLRTHSRGGTPKGVLDCMARAVPVMINNHASYVDYPDDVVYKFSPLPKRDEISAAFEKLYEHADKRNELAQAGRLYVKQNHDPNVIAATYASALNEFSQHKSSLHRDINDNLCFLLRSSNKIEKDMESLTQYVKNQRIPNFKRPKVIVDVSHIAKMDHGTGIQRTVKEIIATLVVRNEPGLDCVPVLLNEDQELLYAYDWLNSHGLLAPSGEKNAAHQPDFYPGDHFLMLDSSWERYDEFAPHFERARKARVSITTVIYDTLPITLLPGNFVEGGPAWFRNWLHKAITQSDNLLCISQSVADELTSYIKEQGLSRPGLSIGWWHLGSNFNVNSISTADFCISKLENQKFFLMVGTLEPRKNHSLALDAFERLWQEGFEQTLVFAGKKGWNVDELYKRIENHPQYNKKLFLLEEMSDGQIGWLYKNAQCVMFLSQGEGFGLPLIEAVYYQTPVICSDIPVFHEIAQQSVTYTDIQNPEIITASIKKWFADFNAGTLPRTDTIKPLSWAESAEQLIDVVVNGNWHICLQDSSIN